MPLIAPRLLHAGFDYDQVLAESNLSKFGWDRLIPQLPAAINQWGYLLPDMLLAPFVQELQGEFALTVDDSYHRSSPIKRSLILVEPDLNLARGIIDILLLEYGYPYMPLEIIHTTSNIKGLVLATLLHPFVLLADVAPSGWNGLHIMHYFTLTPSAQHVRLGYILPHPFRLPKSIPYPSHGFILTKPFNPNELIRELDRGFEKIWVDG